MKYDYDFQIPYQEVDMNRRLRLYTMENYLLNVAGKVADDCGYGIQALLPYGYTWVVTRLNLEIQELPTHTEHIRIRTWIERNQHMLSTRAYLIYRQLPNQEWQLIGKAQSIWAVLDIEKREIVNAFDKPMFAESEDGEILPFNRSSRMPPIITPTHTSQRTVVYSDIDYNHHCNSCKYLEMMIDSYRPDFLYEKVPIRLDINYSKEVYLDEQLTILSLSTLDNTTYHIKNQNGQTSCTARLTKLDNFEC